MKRAGGKKGKAAEGARAPEERRPAPERRPQEAVPPWDRRGVWIALGAIAILLIAFFNPIFFNGKTFQPPDTVASVAHRPYINEALQSPGSWFDKYPLWTPYVFSGMPSLGSMIAAPYTNPLSTLIPISNDSIRVISFYLLIGFFSWLFMRRLGLTTLPALLGAVAFLMTPHVITLIMFGHNSKVCTLALLPVVLLATHALWTRPNLRHAALLALAIGVMLLTHHVQIAYYTLLAAGLYLVVATVEDLRARHGARSVLERWGFWIGGLLVGGAASAMLLLPVQEYAAHSIRGGAGGGLTYDYATNWSFHPLEVTTFFLPSFVGFGQNSYWGWMPFTDFPHYMGILVLLLAVVTMILWPRERLNLYFAILAVVSLLLSFGRHLPLFYDLMFRFFPYFDKFRVPSMILFLTQFSVAMLAGRGLFRLLGPLGEAERRRAVRVVLITGAACFVVMAVLAALAGSGAMDGTIRERLTARFSTSRAAPDAIARVVAREMTSGASLVTADAVWVGLALVLGVGMLFLGLRRKVSATAVAAAILVLTVVDLWRIGEKPADYKARQESEQEFEPTPSVRFLKQDPSLYRVLPLTGGGVNNNWLAYFKISSILGYHPAKLRIYQDVIDEKGPVGISKSLRAGNFNVVNMLNMKYMISPQDIPLGPLVAVHHGDKEVVMENRAVLPRLWFVDGARVIAEEPAHLEALADPEWDPSTLALLFEEPGSLDAGAAGQAEIVNYSPRSLEARVVSPGNCLLVLSEVYYEPGWKASIDGADTPVLRADYLLRAVRVPPGEHTVTMRFDDPAFRKGTWITAASFAVILVALGVSFVPRRRESRPEAPAIASS